MNGKKVNIPGFPYPVTVRPLGRCETIKTETAAYVQFNHPRTHYNVGFTCRRSELGPLRAKLEGMSAEIIEALR